MYHISHDMEINAGDFFKVLLKYKMAAIDKIQKFLLVQKLEN